MADRQRRLWFGDWGPSEDEAPTQQLPVSEPAPAAAPARESIRERVVAQRAQRRGRAWTIAAATGAAVFAFSFGYVYGEVRNGTDPAMKKAAVKHPVQPVTPNPGAVTPGGVDPSGGFDPQGVYPGSDQQQVPVDPSQGLPPVTTRQS